MHYRIIATAIGPALVLGLATARAQDITKPAADTQRIEALQAKVERLEAKVEELQSNQPTFRPADTDAIVQEVLADADSQSQPAALASGYDPAVGFVLRSTDGNFCLRPGLVIDFRNDTSYRADIPKNSGSVVPGPASGYDTQTGFNLARVRLTFSGNYTPNLTYFVQFQDDQGTAFGLLDAYGIYKFNPDGPWAIKAGQFKDPVWHERNLSEANLMAVDRSLVEDLLGGGQASRVQGAGLIFDQDRLRTQLIYHDGFNSINSPFYDTGGLGAGVGGGAGVTPTNFGVSNRTEFLALGRRDGDHHPFAQYDGGFSALGAQQNILVFGAGADYSQGGGNSVILHSVDAQFDTTFGLSLYAAYLGSWRDLHYNQGLAPGYSYDPGFLIQAAYLVTPKLEPFVRYDNTNLQSKTLAASNDLITGRVQELTGGFNYYLYRQALKFTVDASWLPDGSPADIASLGVLKDSGHNEFLLRFQLQLSL